MMKRKNEKEEKVKKEIGFSTFICNKAKQWFKERCIRERKRDKSDSKTQETTQGKRGSNTRSKEKRREAKQER